MYDDLKEYIAYILKRNGFRVKKDLKCPEGWIDVAGFKMGFSVGIEIGDPERVAGKLSSYPFNLKVVVCDCNRRKEGDLLVTDVKGLCEELNLDCPDFEEWISSRVDRDRLLYENTFRLLLRKLLDEKVARRALDAILYLYMAGEVVEDYSGKVTEKIPFVRLYPTLVECGLAIRDTREIVKPKTFMTSLTMEGVRVAKVVLRDKIRENAERISKLARDIGEGVLYVILTGLAERRGLVLKETDLGRFEVPRGSVDEIYYSILPIFAELDFDEVVKILRSTQDPFVALCKVMSYSVFYHVARELMENLFKMGLCAKVPVYDYYGQFFGYEYRASKEVAEILSKHSKLKIGREIVERFKGLMMLAQLKRSRDFEIAAERGIIRVKRGGAEIADAERFRDFMRVRMAKVIAEAVSDITS